MPLTRMIDACFERLGVVPVYTPNDGAPKTVKLIAKRPDEIVGFGDTRLHAETAMFDLRASEVATPYTDDRLAVD